MVKGAISFDINARPSQIQSNAIIAELRNLKSWDDVEKTVKEISIVKKISSEKIKQRNVLQPSESLAAVQELKLYCDKNDKFFVYEINENEQYVFETSR